MPRAEKNKIPMLKMYRFSHCLLKINASKSRGEKKLERECCHFVPSSLCVSHVMKKA